MEFHPAAEIFPLMSETEFASLCKNVRERGLIEPIWTFRGKIIDGRNRYKACLESGVEPRFREWDGIGSLIEFVVSLNMHRRHLTESQRAMVAARIATMRQGERTDLDSIEAKLSQEDSANLLNVSRSSVQRAGKVRATGTPELIDKVERGEISVTQGAEIARLPENRQKSLIRKGRAKGQKILDRLKTKSLKRTLTNTDSSCLLCNPNAVADKKSVSAFMQTLAKRHRKFARYFNSVVDEMEELELADEALDAKEKTLGAISSGYQTFSEIQLKTKIESDFLQYTLSLLLDYGDVTVSEQGGKTETARGARKILYQLTEADEESYE
jgi:ParB-like chromosome segregation protein Spo0J